MRIKPEFFICEHCGNLISLMEDKGVSITCCGQKMTKLEPNTVDAAVEKHLPVATLSEGVLSVEIGSVIHPMTPEHHIKWIFVCCESHGQRKVFDPTDEPKFDFFVGEEKSFEIFAYCNLHGLWKAEI